VKLIGNTREGVTASASPVAPVHEQWSDLSVRFTTKQEWRTRASERVGWSTCRSHLLCVE